MNKVTFILIAIIILILAVLAAYKLKGTGLLSKLRSMGNYTSMTTTNNTVTYTSPVPSPSGTLDQQLNQLDSSINKAQSGDNDTDPTTGL